jgi:uncharacterized SAM-binding protein YcdF (DUF218 family)
VRRSNERDSTFQSIAVGDIYQIGQIYATRELDSSRELRYFQAMVSVVIPLGEALVLPPGLLALLALGVVVLLVLRRRKGAIVLAAVAAGLAYLLSTGFVARILLTPLENRYPPLSRIGPSGVDDVVVLGGGAVARKPGGVGSDALTPNSFVRLAEGTRVSRSLGIPVIVTGGIAPESATRVAEADVAREVVERYGMTGQTVLTESSSRDTWENARRVEQAYHPRAVILVTSAFHMPRSVIAFRKNGMRVIADPTAYLVSDTGWTWYDFVPQAEAFDDSAIALKEYLGILDYRLRRAPGNAAAAP